MAYLPEPIWQGKRFRLLRYDLDIVRGPKAIDQTLQDARPENLVSFHDQAHIKKRRR
jgi:hypothetical protein